MDNFMEKITHKFSATDMIKANQQADAAQIDAQRDQLAAFEAQMQQVDSAISEIRELGLRNVESAQEVQTLAHTSEEKLGQVAGRVESESVSRIQQTSELSIAGINKTVDESLAKIERIRESADAVEALEDALKALSSQLNEMQKNLEEHLHTDHVKIYRNVQASFTEELSKQVETVNKKCARNRAVMPLVIVTLVVSVANLAILVMKLLGLI